MRKLITTVILALITISAFGDDLSVDFNKLPVGSRIDLTGHWPYKPGYAIGADEHPESDPKQEGYVPVPVPQILNRIRWWLDDSKDFEKFEDNRLKGLGFDTEKAEDGWYRQWIDVPHLPYDKHPWGKHLFVEFDGVAMKCKVFCNGQPLGEHAGMFSRFSFDLTPHLKAGRNLLAVYVSMEKTPANSTPLGEAVTVNLTASKVLTMSKGMFGPLSPGFPNRAYDLHGIWQPVRLVVRGDAMIDDVWFKPSLDGADVEVTAHSLAGPVNATLVAGWQDMETGATPLFKGVKVTLKPGEPTRATISVRNAKVKLWTPANPNLYKLKVSLADMEGEPPLGPHYDEWAQNVGFRTFEVKGTRLYLNGHPYWLRGANQLPYGKNPTDPALAKKLIQQLHDNNIRVTRTHATPWNEAWLTAADEIGLGVSIEGIRPWALVGKIGPCPPDQFKHWLDENADVIRRGRNHPSVLIWTVGNEMMLRDADNPEKWKQLSEVVKQTRELDPTRPVVCSSTYARDEKLYTKVIKPNGFDDGDLDDVHYYRGWYSASPFVTDSTFAKEAKDRGSLPPRCLIGQEMAAGYPDLDTGLPVLRYTRDLVTPQAWIGVNAYPGGDPSIFLEHERAVNKRWAEQLRFQRTDHTSGFMLFSAECWFSHSYDPQKATPYSTILEGVKQAYQPVGLAIETGRRRFFAGEHLKTTVFVTNDDEQFRDLSNVEVRAQIVSPGVPHRTPQSRAVWSEAKVTTPGVPYYATQALPLELDVPRGAFNRSSLALVLTATAGGVEISRTIEFIEVFPAADVRLNVQRPEDSGAKGDEIPFSEHSFSAGDTVTVLGGPADLKRLEPLTAAGKTVILLSPGKSIVDAFPNDILDAKDDVGEYADWAPVAGTALAADLQPMDLKWWGRKDDWRCCVLTASHRLKPGGKARELVRFIPAHSYISADKIPQQYRVAMFEIPVGKGRVWVCDLDLEASVNVDPAAALFARNLLKAAADPHSTENLPRMPTHEEMLKGRE